MERGLADYGIVPPANRRTAPLIRPTIFQHNVVLFRPNTISEAKMTFERLVCAAVGLLLTGAAMHAHAQPLDRVAFATNWVAQAEHGGFYQALTDGTYRKYGLDVRIIQGGPNVNNRLLLPVGRIDMFMSANTLQSFDAVENKVPTLAVAAIFQKEPQVFVVHPDQGIDKFEDLKGLTLFVSR